MRQWCVLLVACVVVAYQLHMAEAQFSFSLPGKWGNSGKRSMWGKRLGECGEFDSEVIYNIYKIIQAEALRITHCMQDVETKVDETKKH